MKKYKYREIETDDIATFYLMTNQGWELDNMICKYENGKTLYLCKFRKEKKPKSLFNKEMKKYKYKTENVSHTVENNIHFIKEYIKKGWHLVEYGENYLEFRKEKKAKEIPTRNTTTKISFKPKFVNGRKLKNKEALLSWTVDTSVLMKQIAWLEESTKITMREQLIIDIQDKLKELRRLSILNH